ncbi:Geranylgeranyl transferase type-2 subunit alpha [Toxocara canis]|uniref:Geranylgeranyl transferase type-2 subunit alpha n=1 Tax=Toxocara canis TaxID=6265 RepID=A0A0B2VSB1_TOXCA|nr:Geranylgeranyl transferase type-2 subunit alpha [Toxocara canis]
MHFVKKVPTTEEERIVKEKQRAAKLRAYCEMRDRVFSKRAKGEMDDEMLDLTAKLLAKNPDVYTFWNIRRATIQNLMSERSEGESEETIAKRNDLLLLAELSLTEQCLLENSKSYGAWFHRGWALALMNGRDVNRELKVTEKALQLDARNFHCWDHRRFVAKLADVTPEQELQFSERMINANFSNYSAWHYRSTLLPLVSPSSSEASLDDETIMRELKKLANAFFTDPEDQSAWIYTEWLISMDPHNAIGDENTKVISVTFDESRRSAIVMLSAAVSVDAASKLISFPSLAQATVSRIPVSRYNLAKYARVFVMSAPTELGSAVLRSPAGLVLEEVEPEEGYADVSAIYSAFSITQRELSNARRKALGSAMENCSALIEELSHEPTVQLNKPIPSYALFLTHSKDGRAVMSAPTELGSAVLRSPAGLVLEEVEPEEGYADVSAIYSAFSITQRELSNARRKALGSAMENCSALIEELSHEPTVQLNKWPLFTLTRCLMELDAVQYHQQIIDNLERLATDLDAQRRNMYEDLLDKHRLNAYLRSVDREGDVIIDKIIHSAQKGAQLNPVNMALRSLNHLQLLAAFVTIIDVSYNMFSDLHSFAMFPRLTHLTLNGNPIHRLDELCAIIPKVEYLAVASTAVGTFDDVAAVFESKALRRFIFCETPLAADEQHSQKLYRFAEERRSPIMLIRHWL